MSDDGVKNWIWWYYFFSYQRFDQRFGGTISIEICNIFFYSKRYVIYYYINIVERSILILILLSKSNVKRIVIVRAGPGNNGPRNDNRNRPAQLT